MTVERPTLPRQLVLLLPSHGMEDLPETLEEDEAEELLAAFACLSHPAASIAVDRPPTWDRADLPPALHAGDVVILPSNCEPWIEPTWVPEVEAAGVIVLQGHRTLANWYQAVTTAFESQPLPEFIQEAFASVGITRLFVERFARRMHDFDGIDESRLHDALAAAARTIFEAPDADQADVVGLLGSAFDCLLEYRERIHPLDPHLLDVLLLADDDAETLAHCLSSASDLSALNVMADRRCLESVLAANATLAESISGAWANHAIDLLLGESEDCETRLEPSEVTGERLADVRRWSIETFKRPPRVWARREYGLHPDLPMLLKSAGYEGAIHLTFDVGPYPDIEDAKLTWQAPDRTGIEAFSRLPIPAARASTFWQFSDRLAESVEFDTASAVMFVRWADAEPWWYRSFRWAAVASPVFGRFTTAGEFLATADGHGTVLRADAREYGSAALAKRAALKERDPLGKEVDRWKHYVDLVGNRIAGGLGAIVALKREPDPHEMLGVGELTTAIAGGGEPTGTMFLNPFPFDRVATRDHADHPIRVSVPAYGYAWVAEGEPPPSGRPLVEGHVLRNEFFELEISEKSGGLKRLMQYGRRGNFLSQHVARRTADDSYITCQAASIQVVEQSSAAAAIESIGTLVNDSGEELAQVTQRLRVVRGQRWFDLTVSIDGEELADGNPWLEYDAVRFAWSTEFAAVSQSCGLSPVPAGQDRLESPMFVEVDDDPVITIITHGRTFHRRSERVLDSLVCVAGETRRPSRFSVAVGVSDPASLAMTAMADPAKLAVPSAKPRTSSAWLLSINTPGVVALNIWSEDSPDDDQPRFVIRLRETNGAARVATVRLCRPVAEAVARDFSGRLTDRLTIREGAVEVRLREHQMRELVLRLS